MSKRFLMTKNFPSVAAAKVPNHFLGLGELGPIIDEDDLRFRGILLKTRQAAASDRRRVVDRYYYGEGCAGLSVFRGLRVLHVSGEVAA
jgi:hypothetical protein